MSFILTLRQLKSFILYLILLSICCSPITSSSDTATTTEEHTCTEKDDEVCGVASTSECEDLEPECEAFVAYEEDMGCWINSYYMYTRCKKSCDACLHSSFLEYYNDLVLPIMNLECENYEDDCHDWTKAGECQNNPDYMMDKCPMSCDICIPVNENVDQDLRDEDDETHLMLLEHVDRMNAYYEEVLVSNDPKYIKVRKACKNIESECIFWAATGECDPDKHYAYMMARCPLACMSCEMMDVENRCPVPDSLYDGDFEAGDIDAMFERIVKGEYGSSIVVHSAPSHYASIEGRITSDDDIKLDGPWIVTFDDFLSAEEAAQLIVLGYDQGFLRSTDVGVKLADGSYEHTESSTRTSENAWCTDECDSDPIVKKISNRIENITGIPVPNHENFQILRYREDQFYESHHDFIEHQVMRPCGPRLLTFFLYLSDVEEGGGTTFTDLDLTISPKVGRALLWPSVINDNVNEKDFRTHHEALPVIRGDKFAANAWLHLRNFRDWADRGCV